MENLWQQPERRDEISLLVYRSRLIGAIPHVVNFGGGNTSCKTVLTDYRGRSTEALIVKASGTDLATIDISGFTALRLDDLRALATKVEIRDEDLVEYLQFAMLDPRSRPPSIETTLHALLPFKHIDHTHPVAALAFCALEHGREVVERMFGRRAAWVPYMRPGFALGKLAAEVVRANPYAEFLLLEKHGLVTWAETAEACYQRTLDVLDELNQLTVRALAVRDPFATPATELVHDHEERLCTILPILRGALRVDQCKILTYDDSQAVRQFLASPNARELAARGSATPDYVLYTGPFPLWLDDGIATLPFSELPDVIRQAVARYRQSYTEYFTAHAVSEETMIESNPRIILLPGLGIVAAGHDFHSARTALANYCQTIEVMRAAEALDHYSTLSLAQTFAIEYWPLERAKLQRRASRTELAGQVALITGGASGIGRAIAHRLAVAGAHVVILDRNAVAADEVAQVINDQHGDGRGLAIACDVTSEEAINDAFRRTILYYGGVDIVIPNAGLAASHSIEETTLAEWKQLHDVMVTGYFLTARSAFRLLRQQGTGGAIVFMSSKNGLSAAKHVLAYATAKAAELQMTRCLAEEGGSAGIRVNAVAPDAVFRGSAIWNPQWRSERARSHGVALEELEEYYRQRSVLKVNVFPEDVAEAVLFLCSQRSAKTTGCTITVDGGVTTAYPR